MQKYPKSDHFDGQVFFNPENRETHGFFEFLKMAMKEKRAKWPEKVENHLQLKLGKTLRLDQVAVTFVNHATLLIELPGLTILTDPVWAERASPLQWAGPKRVREPGIPLDLLPKIDVVLVSHNHYDHLDLATLKILNDRFAPRIFVALGDRGLLEGAGIERVDEMDWWDEKELERGATIAFTPTQHFSSRSLFDRNKSLWGSYMIQQWGRRIYFGGDAGYSSHFKEIRKRLGPTHLAFLPIGAYEPRWFMGPVHMNPEEAVKAHRDLESQQSVAIHFGTFQLTLEAIDQPVIDLKAALQEAGIAEDRFRVIGEGQTTIFDLGS